MADANSDYLTILGPDAVFKGELTFEKGVRLLGKFEGEIVGGNELVLSDGASLSGDAKAETIQVEGVVKGNLEAAQKVELSSSAKVEGDVQAARLQVAEGAVLMGRCTIGLTGLDNTAHEIREAPAESITGKARGNGPIRPSVSDRRAQMRTGK